MGHLAIFYAQIEVRSRGAAVAKGVTEGWLALEVIASDGAHTTASGRYRCVVEGCGREVLVVRKSPEASQRTKPLEGS
jgi:hypothetical protein